MALAIFSDMLPSLAQDELERIHAKSVELLNQVGFRFADSQRAMDIFTHHGYKTDGDIVFFDEHQIQQAIDTAPSAFRVRALNPANDFVLGEGLCAFSNNAAPAFILDLEGNRRPAVKTDQIDFLKIAHQLDIINLIRPMFDVADKPNGQFAWLIRWALEYTDKVVSGSSREDIELIAAAFDLSREAMRIKATEGITHSMGVCNPRSPLTLERGNCDFCIDQAQWGVACKISPVPIAGMTGPMTLPGLIILQNAEVLAPLVLAQLVNPGTPVLYGVLATTADMQTMATVASPPELAGPLIRAGTQMAKFYQIPSRVDVANTNACDIDFQAGAESALLLANAVWSGADLMATLGSLESRGMGALAKLVLDADLAVKMKSAIAPSHFGPTDFSVQSLGDLDPLRDNARYQAPTKAASDMHARARSEVRRMLDAYRKPDVLTPAKLSALDRIIARYKD